MPCCLPRGFPRRTSPRCTPRASPRAPRPVPRADRDLLYDAPMSRLSYDPVEGARRYWLEQGWDDAAAGVGALAVLRLHGLAGWVSWLFIHIAFLTGYRNRVGAVLTWWVAFTRDRRRDGCCGARATRTPRAPQVGPSRPSQGTFSSRRRTPSMGAVSMKRSAVSFLVR